MKKIFKYCKIYLFASLFLVIGFVSSMFYYKNIYIIKKPFYTAGNNNVFKKNTLFDIRLNNSEYYDYNALFSFVLNKIKTSYVEEIDDKVLYEQALDGILSSLDPHSMYLNKEKYDELKNSTKGEFGGIGIEITKEFSLIKVVSPIEGTPAHRAGIKSGDYITHINDLSVIDMNLVDAVKNMRGDAGSKVKLTVLRSGGDKALTFNITRDNISIKSVRSELYNNIIYLKINSFTEKSHQETIKNLSLKLKEIGDEDKVEGIILDLRDNPGGLLDQSIAVSELFLDYGKDIVSTKGRGDIVFGAYKSNNKKPFLPNVPMIVLINGGSASASEIVAGALQDNNRALIVGTKSFGKGSVQSVLPTPMDGAIKMTTARYYTPSGRSIQAKGIDPDIVVKQNKLIIEKDNEFSYLKEEDLKGHLKNTDDDLLSKKIKEVTKNSLFNKFEDLYEKDYQLARAIDLLIGVNIFNKK